MSVLSNAVFSAATATVNCLEGTPCDTGLPVVNASSGLLQTVLQLVFGVLAVLAVIVITIAGIRFIVESTNPQETARARSTIIYALIGLTIALSGEFIVSFVLDQL